VPSNAWRRGAGFAPVGTLPFLGSDYPRPNQQVITTWSIQALGFQLPQNYSSQTYPAANRALACPIIIAETFTVRKVVWFNGVTATTDSVDVGVYTEDGALLVSGGGTAVSGQSASQEADVTDTVLKPGRYWMAYAQNGVTATPWMSNGAVSTLRIAGCAQMATAYPLPSTFTPAAIASANFPLFGIASRTAVS
jgi:hypothetical protein